MKVTHWGDDLIQINNRWFPCNVYLVRENDGFTLIDTGLPASAKAFIKIAQKAGGEIRRIALTHSHGDHVGSLAALHTLLPDAEISVSERESAFLKGDMRLLADEPQTPLRGGFSPVDITPNRVLNEGERVGSLQVVTSAGHTPGHIAFYDIRHGHLIAGDAFSTQAGISVAGTRRLLFPFPAMGTWDRPTSLDSAEKLVRLNPTLLATGHGRVLENPVNVMQEAIEVTRQKLG